MFKPRVYVTRQIFPDALDLIEKFAELELWPDDEPPSPEQLMEAMSNVEGAIINVMDRIDAPLLDAAPKLRVLSQVAAGLDNIDIPEATKRDIMVGYTPGVLAKSTADLAFALLLAVAAWSKAINGSGKATGRYPTTPCSGWGQRLTAAP